MDLNNVGIAAMSFFATVIGAAFVVRHMVNEHKQKIDLIFLRIEKHGDDLVRLNTKSELSITAKDVDDKYVSKEYFKQFEKHMDKRFDDLQAGQGKILDFIEKTAKNP